MILDWRKFVLRSDIKNLPLEEQRRRFLKEQLYNDNLLSEQKQRQYEFYMSQMAGGGSAAGGFSGQAVDGPIVGATVISNVGTTITDALGQFKFKKKPTGPITVTGGTDSITGIAFEGELIGYPEYKTISPITTFAHYLKQATEEDSKVPNLTIDEAITKTFVSSSDYFGINLPIENKDTVLQKDYIRESIENNSKIGISAQAVATQIEAITETLGVSLQGSNEAQDAQKAGREIQQFTTKNRKRTAYAALGREAKSSGTISFTNLQSRVKFIDPIKNIEVDGVQFADNKILPSQLDDTQGELRTLALQEQYTNNYLTTRIQAVNQAQKTTIKNEAEGAVRGKNLFSEIEVVSTSKEVEDALKQIEKDKANETSPVLDGKVNNITDAAFFQKKINELTGESYLAGLRLGLRRLNYSYFGEAKDAPMILTPGLAEGSYDRSLFPGTTKKTDISAITVDVPVELVVSSTDEETGIITTTKYIARPFIDSKDEEGIQVGLRLSSITQTKEAPKNSVTHISTEGTYTALQIRNGLKTELIPTVVECMLGNEIQLKVNKEDENNIYLLRKNTLSKEAVGFELVDMNAEKAIRGQGTEFNDDAMSITWKDEKGSEIQIDFNFTKSPSVTHIAPASPAYTYKFSIREEGSAIAQTSDMITSFDKETELNILTLESSAVPGVTTKLNNIRLAKDPNKETGFLLTAGNEEDEFKIEGKGSSFEDNTWPTSGSSSVTLGKLFYTITIVYQTNS